ncbi:ATP-binding protein [Actinacidiphila glaucinigra]|uniref:ATP-binding protein n=1 Tax=Actinacidiphila glaucinigra TaxID=235986 RepID=UPI002E3635C9|nr:ATP-binding protein [Actinacidiphila glaucinigra]
MYSIDLDAEGAGTVRPAPADRPLPTTIGEARDFARARLRGVDPERVEDCLLVVSELVTNAFRYGGGLAGFDVVAAPDAIRVSVQDHNDRLPTPPPPSERFLPGGYGLRLVRRLARDIRVTLLRAGGKIIHVHLPR